MLVIANHNILWSGLIAPVRKNAWKGSTKDSSRTSSGGSFASFRNSVASKGFQKTVRFAHPERRQEDLVEGASGEGTHTE